MDPTQVASLTSILAPLFGAKAAGIASLIVGGVFIAGQVMPLLPVAHATSPGWYQVLFGLMARIVGNWRNAAPMPPAGTSPAGGLVPTPPPIKGAT